MFLNCIPHTNFNDGLSHPIPTPAGNIQDFRPTPLYRIPRHREILPTLLERIVCHVIQEHLQQAELQILIHHTLLGSCFQLRYPGGRRFGLEEGPRFNQWTNDWIFDLVLVGFHALFIGHSA